MSTDVVELLTVESDLDDLDCTITRPSHHGSSNLTMIETPHFSVPLIVGSAVSLNTYLTLKEVHINSPLISSSQAFIAVLAFILSPNRKLDKYPGPFLAKFTRLWLARQAGLGNRFETVHTLHQTNGKFLPSALTPHCYSSSMNFDLLSIRHYTYREIPKDRP
jgi:hypothetical protein